MKPMTLAALGALAFHAWEPARSQEVSGDTSARFAQALKKLGSDDYETRQQGSAEIGALPPEALGLVERALKQPNLELEVRSRLEAARPKLRTKARRQALKQRDESARAWNRNSMLEGYAQGGRKDPKWDAPVRQLLGEMAEVWNHPEYDQRESLRRAWPVSEAALKEGCNDPLVLYCHARIYDAVIRKSYPEAVRLHLEAAQRMKEFGGGYHPFRRVAPYARAAEFLLRSKKTLEENDRKQAEGWLTESLGQFEQAAKDPGTPEFFLMDSAYILIDAWKVFSKDRKVGCDQVTASLERARPPSVLPLLIKGKVYTDYAWDARGNGWANTVTPEGWKLMKERLTEAEEALTRAWELHPEDPRAPTQMLVVELGQAKGIAVMETWFKRAMEADPDNTEACNKKLYYLEPKWYGSPELMLEFGRQLLVGGNWEARLPFRLLDAHTALVGYAQDKEAYYRDPKVWEDLKAVFEGYLAVHPEATFDRSKYARWACLCGHYAEARKQFEILGDMLDVDVFADRAEMERLRAKAFPPAPPPEPARGEPIDLLGRVDPDKDAVSGSWKLEGKALVSPSADFSRLQVSVQVPEEYDLLVVAQRSGADKADTLAIGLVGIRGPFMVGLDGDLGKRSGIDAIDGKRFVENESTREGAVFPPDQAVTVRIAVRKNRVVAIVDGKMLLDWKAGYDRLSMRAAWAVRDAKALFLGCNKCSYRVTKWELIPAGAK